MKVAIIEKIPGMLFHHGNAVSQASRTARGKLNESKLFLTGRKFKTDERITAEIEHYFDDPDVDDYTIGIMALYHHWSRCINVEGNVLKN